MAISDMLQEYDLRNTPSIEASVRHSDVVYNLVGRDYPTKYESDGRWERNQGRMLTARLGTSPWRMFMSRVRRESSRPWPSTMWTATFTSRRIARTPSPRRSSTQPRSVPPSANHNTSSADQIYRDEVRRLHAASTPRLLSCDPPPCSASRTTCCSSWLRP